MLSIIGLMIRRLWDRQWRAIVIMLALVVVLVWGLALTQPHKLTDGVWTVKVGKCDVDYQPPIRAVALACPGVDCIKLWPLPPEQPWQKTPDPLPGPGPGWYAWKEDPAQSGVF